MSSSREYDPEIKDIADYVANKTIDSELAVSFAAPLREIVGRLRLPLIFKGKKNHNGLFFFSYPAINWDLPRWLREEQKLARERGEEDEKIESLIQLLTATLTV